MDPYPKRPDYLYRLFSPDGSGQVLISERGAQVTSWLHEGVPIIYLQRPIGEKLRGGIPICYPLFGPSKLGISQHGFLRDTRIRPSESEIDMKSDRLRFVGKYFGQKEVYPFDIECPITIRVCNDSLDLGFEVRRFPDQQDKLAPLNVAWHPYFSNLGASRVQFGSVDREVFVGQDETIPLDGNRVIVIGLGEKRVQMTLGGDFDEKACLTLWTDSDKYFCVEPSQTHPDAFGTSSGSYIGQNKEMRLNCSLKVLP